VIEIESRAEFDAHLRKTQRLNGWIVQSVDLRERTDALLNVDPGGAVFLGCLFAPRPSSIICADPALCCSHGCPTCRWLLSNTSLRRCQALRLARLPAQRRCSRLRLVTFPRWPVRRRC